MKLVDRVAGIGTESAFEVLARARALEKDGRNIVHLEIGEPDFPTPTNIIEAGKRALQEGWTKYGPTPGLPELREAIAAHISSTRGQKVTADSVCVVPGGKPIMFFTILALINPGDEVIYPDPGFPIYESMIRFQGGVPVPIPLEENRGFSFDVDYLAAKLSTRTKLVILNSPHNPTGGIIPAADLKQISDLVRDLDLMILSDEIYSRIWYESEPVSITRYDGMMEKTILLDGFSKTYSMTGWRLGFGVMPPWLANAVTKLMVNSNSCTASFTQRAGLEALQGPQDTVTAMVAEFRRRRDAICMGLNEIPGFRCVLPAGAFYAFPNIRATGMGSKKLEEFLLNEAGVASLSGGAFGKYGEGYLRFSYANSLSNIMDAIERIKSVSGHWEERFVAGLG